MKFGKVARPELVDFSFPALSAGTKNYLSSFQESSDKTDFYLGATGWSMREWINLVYPKGTKSQDFGKVYSQQFNTIEFNTTHYRIPNFEMVQKWKKESAADFKFCPKLPQTISHRNDMGIGSGQLDLFLESIAGLDEKLGACFMQLPPYFGPDRLGQLLHFLDHWPAKELRLCIEFRQEDWFSSAAGREVFEELRKRQIGAVITDVAGRRDVLHLELTAPFTMIRYVGNGLITSDYDRMNAWKALLEDWAAKGLETVYFFLHQPDNILAPQACEIFGKKLSSQIFSFRYPKLITSQPSGQMDLF